MAARHGHWTDRLMAERLNARALAVISSALFLVFLLSPAPPTSGAGVGSVDATEPELALLLDLSAESAEAPPDEGLYYSAYQVQKGDTVSGIAQNYGVTVDAIVTLNGITNTRSLSVGRFLKVPSMTGILYAAKEGDTVSSLADTYAVSAEGILEANRLGEGSEEEALPAGRKLFLPDARMSSLALREINGDLFKKPVQGWITSRYGWRNDPLTGARSFHTGLDIGAAYGTPVRAAMEGRVTAVGYSAVSGNYVIIAHHDGYTTMYAHLSKQAVKVGARVTQASVIGYVGSTGYSTGPHLHFTVSKWGRTMNPALVLN